MVDVKPGSAACELAEAFGAFVIVLVGCGAMITMRGGPDANVAVAAAFGGAVAAAVYATAHVSGAHLNPAITLGLAAVGRFPWRRAPSYVACQVAGASLAAAVLAAGMGSSVADGTTRVAPGIPFERAVLLEVVFTFLLAFVIAAVATDPRAPRGIAGLAIGLAVALGSLVIGPLTGASMNPARTVGPAIISGVWDDLAVYVVGPALGGLLGFVAYEPLRRAGPPPAPSGAPASAPAGSTEGGVDRA